MWRIYSDGLRYSLDMLDLDQNPIMDAKQSYMAVRGTAPQHHVMPARVEYAFFRYVAPSQ